MNEPDYSAQGPSDGFGPEDLLGCYARGVLPMVSEDTILREFKYLIEQNVVKKTGSTKAAKYILNK